MYGRRALLIAELPVFVWQVHIEVDHIVELIQVTKTVFTNCYLLEHGVLRANNHVFDLRIVMVATNPPELTRRYAVHLVQVRRVKQGVLERDEHAEIQPVSGPLFEPIPKIKGGSWQPQIKSK